MVRVISSRPIQLALLGALVLALLCTLAARLAETAAAAPTELFFSEYVEGSSNNKALEIYNGTGSPVTLTGVYDVQIFANGSLTATATIPLTGTVAAGDVFVLARNLAAAAVLGQTDQTTTNFLFNGNDAVALRNAGTIVDVIGQIGVDPGTEWGTGDASTLDNTLRRKPSIQSGDPNGADAFDPATEWAGFPIDSFDGLGAHSVTGGGGGGGGGTNHAPNAVADTASLEEDSPAMVAVLANDSDPDGDPLTVSATTDPSHGAATISTDGSSVSYAPEVDYSGPDSFTYTVSDGHGGTSTTTVSLTVSAVNDDPDVEDDTVTTAEDTAITVDALANDADPESDALVVTSADSPGHGTATVSADGSHVTYSPEPDYNGTDVFEYTASDGQGGEDIGEVTVQVTAVNDPPRANADTATVAPGGSVVIDVVANDSAGPANESGQTLVVSSVGAAGHGVATLIGTGADQGKVRYTPTPGYTGSDSFTYVASDGSATATGTVSVTVTDTVAFKAPCGVTPTIVGTPGDDVITGTPGDDVIRGRRGNDVIDGNGGNDVVCGGPGLDRITTGDGIDRVAGGSGNDTLSTGGGADRVRGGFGNDVITAAAGDDSVAGGQGNDDIDAGDGANRVKAGPGDDHIRAGSGNDRIDGGPGADTCDADGGKNTLIACE